MPEAIPAAAVLSDRFYVDNDQIRDNTYDIEEGKVQVKRNVSGKMICEERKHQNVEIRPMFFRISISEDK